ncbi:hypothetical protein [Paraburkholderia caribensis]|uniref:hypothetical protein n=1 Tax=Paraburkholderia caribensis TaxID=75105 RepID=UPI002090B5E9|nr:hypothetical protein [Paraburkholderia caribensis]MCO4880236.1 hypothetical protein [Paraburkholderia caribensis]
MTTQAKLDRNLNFVLPLESGAIAYIRPLKRFVFDANYLALAKVYSAIQEQDMMSTGGSIAARMLRDLEKNQGFDAQSVLIEIRRMTTVAVKGANGYETPMLEDALSQGLVDEDDVAEIENFMVFTTAASYLTGSKERAARVIQFTAGMRNVETTSLALTDYLSSSATLKTVGNSGAKAEAAQAE